MSFSERRVRPLLWEKEPTTFEEGFTPLLSKRVLDSKSSKPERKTENTVELYSRNTDVQRDPLQAYNLC